MKVLLDQETNVVIDIVDETRQVSNGLQVLKNDDIYIYASIIPITTIEKDVIPEGVSAQKYMYVNEEFVLNPDYVEPNNA